VCKRVSEKPDCACARFVLAGGSSGAAPVCAVTGFVNAVTQLANAVTPFANAVTQHASSMTASASSVAQLESPVIPSPNAMTARAAQ
jgi:hypothetical protein